MTDDTTTIIALAVTSVPAFWSAGLVYWRAYGRDHGNPRPTLGGVIERAIYFSAGAAIALSWRAGA